MTTPTTPTTPPTSTHLARYALAAAARGWHVFPIRPRSKKPPAVRDWEHRATTDPDRIRRFWQTYGPYNVGIATGPSNLVVIDLDVPKPGQTPPPEWDMPGVNDGADVFAALCEQHRQPFPLGDTFTVQTGRGGWHLYFTAPPGTQIRNSNGNDGPGLGWLIDTRAHGGYVVGPGSHVTLDDGTGSYHVIHNTTPAPLPDWLSGLLNPTHRPSPALEGNTDHPTRIGALPAYGQAALKGGADRVASAERGSRNQVLNNNAYQLGQLIGAGVLPEDLVAQVLYDAASVHFGPEPHGIPPAAARATIRAAITAGKRKPRTITQSATPTKTSGKSAA